MRNKRSVIRALRQDEVRRERPLIWETAHDIVLVVKTQRGIDLLKEYRSVLFTTAVMGEIMSHGSHR